MANSTLDREIKGRIELFLQEITSLVRISALESVLETLGGDAAHARRKLGRPVGSGTSKAAPKATKKGVRGKRTSEQVDAMAQRVLQYVKSNPGQGLERIGKGLGSPTADLKLPVAKLMGSKSLKTTGQRRGMKYFPAGSGAAKTSKTHSKSKSGRKAGGKKNGRKSKAGTKAKAKHAPMGKTGPVATAAAA